MFNRRSWSGPSRLPASLSSWQPPSWRWSRCCPSSQRWETAGACLYGGERLQSACKLAVEPLLSFITKVGWGLAQTTLCLAHQSGLAAQPPSAACFSRFSA